MSTFGDETAVLFHRAAEAAARFRTGIGARVQRPEIDYAEALRRFDAPTPETGLAATAVIDDLIRRATPGLSAMTGPRFFGWVIGGSHPVGVAADVLTSAWGQNVGNHAASPGAAAAEAVAARWLLDVLDLPRDCSVGFVTGATVANFVGLAAARSAVLRRVGWDVEAKGLFGAPPITVLIGEEAHITVFSGLQFLGLGRERVTRVATDEQGRMLPSAFAAALDKADGPLIAIVQAGQVNSGAFDPVADILPMAHARGAWVHVDGAFGLWARACPAHAHLAVGLDLADSWATDGHKWLQTPYDCGYAIVRDSDAHRRAMTIAASYLPEVAAGERDPSHLVPELSRRARGFPTWALLRHFGRQGIAAMVERHCRLARRIADRLREEPGIDVVNDVVLNQVAVRFGADLPPQRGDALTQSTIAEIQRDGVCFAGGALWRGRQIMRVSVMSASTSDADAERSAEAICAAWRRVRPPA
jgi:glutamate/tyrosine decarboxylase-like PLP-dependent enzyme